MWWPWNVVWLVFPSWVILYANEWEGHPNNWETTNSLVFRQFLGAVLAPLGVSFSLQTENQGLVKFDLSVILDPFDFNWFVMPLVDVIPSKVLPCPLHSCFMLFL